MSEMLGSLICFALGGLCGAGLLFVSLANEMEQGPRLPWRSRRIFWRFFGDRSFEQTAERAERSRRELYALVLIGTMMDLGGHGRSPYPRSKEATEGLLAEAERRFQFETRKGESL